MHIRTVLAFAAVVLASTAGAASAADRFSALDRIAAEAMSKAEMDAIVGRTITHIKVRATTSDGFTVLSVSKFSVADDGPTFDFSDDFMPHGGCPDTGCGSGHLTGWQADLDPLPRGFALPPGQIN